MPLAAYALSHKRLPHPRPAKRIAGIQPRLWAIFSPDGKSVLSGGEDGTARLWDSATGAARGEPLRHEGPVLSMAFSPDSTIIVTGSYDGTARMWDAATCRQRGPDLPHLGRVLAVAIRFDGQFVATGSAVEDRDLRTGERTMVAGEVRLWHAASGTLFGEPMRHSLKVWSVAFRPRGGKLLVGGSDRAARFYSIYRRRHPGQAARSRRHGAERRLQSQWQVGSNGQRRRLPLRLGPALGIGARRPRRLVRHRPPR